MADIEDLDDPKPAGNGKIMIIVLAVNLVALAGIGAFVFLGGGGSEATAKSEESVETLEEDTNGPPVLFKFQPFIVNLDEPGASRYLKLTVEAEVRGGEKGLAVMEPRRALAQHSVLTYLSALSFSDTQGAESKKVIQEQMVKEINESLKRDVVKQVYFTEFVIQ